MAVSFLPFPTRLVTEAIRDTEAERAAVVFYGLSLLVIASLIAGLWTAVARNRALLRPEVSDEEVDAILRLVAPNIGFYVLVTAVATPFRRSPRSATS
jgi:hypothetical protein